MATMSEIVTRALRRIRVINPRESAGGQELNDGVTVLNEVMHSWKAAGIDTGHDTLTSSDDFPLDEAHERGAVALLGERLASDYGVPVPPAVAEDAAEGLVGLRAEYQPVEPVSFEDGIVWSSVGRRGRERQLS